MERGAESPIALLRRIGWPQSFVYTCRCLPRRLCPLRTLCISVRIRKMFRLSGVGQACPCLPCEPQGKVTYSRYSSKVKSENCTPTTRAVGPPYAPTFVQFLVRVRVPPSTNVHGDDSTSLIHEQEFRSHICLGANASNDAELVAVRGVPG